MKFPSMTAVAALAVACLTSAASASAPTSAPQWLAGDQSALTGTMPIFSKNGADDPAGHNAGDDRGGKGRGADDGPNHA